MKNTKTLLIGIFLGIIFSFSIIYLAAPSMMIKENVSKYNFDETITQFEEAVKTQGWTITNTNDLQASLAKFNFKVDAVKVFELCKPDYAYKILSNNDSRVVSSMMPCRVAIYEKEGKVIISRMNSSLIAKTFGGVVSEVMDQASADNEIMINSVIAD